MEIDINYFLVCQDNLSIKNTDFTIAITIEELFSYNNQLRFKEFENDIFFEYANR